MQRKKKVNLELRLKAQSTITQTTSSGLLSQTEESSLQSHRRHYGTAAVTPHAKRTETQPTSPSHHNHHLKYTNNYIVTIFPLILIKVQWSWVFNRVVLICSYTVPDFFVSPHAAAELYGPLSHAFDADRQEVEGVGSPCWAGQR